MVVIGYYFLMILFSIVIVILIGFYLDLYLLGDIVLFLFFLIFGIILIVYLFL